MVGTLAKVPAKEIKVDLEPFGDEWWNDDSFTAWVTAKELSLLSWLAYSDRKEIDKICNEPNCAYRLRGMIQPAYSEQACCLFTRTTSKGDVLVLVFRGSDDPTDWWDNINCYSVKEPKSKIDVEKERKIGLHSGFANRYGHFEHEIRDQLTEMFSQEDAPVQVWVTGHSLGGALAVVCAHQLVFDKKLNVDKPVKMKSNMKEKLCGVITFAQPMICKGEFLEDCQKKLADKYVHFVNDNDIVPRLAPSYSHFGLMVRFLGEDVYMSKEHMAKAAGVDPGMADRLTNTSFVSPRNEPSSLVLNSSIDEKALDETKFVDLTTFTDEFFQFKPTYFKKDHGIKSYLEKIEGILNSKEVAYLEPKEGDQ